MTTHTATTLQEAAPMGSIPQAPFASGGHAVLDSAHIGDIRGALGTIAQHDVQPRLTFRHRLRTLLAILGPGLIVMVGDNDAGAFGTYTQAGQHHGFLPLSARPI